MTSPNSLQELSQDFLQLAEAVDASGARVPTALSTAHALCARLIPQQTGATQTLLEDLAHRLEVWQQVWPRLSKDGGFRIAVARESRLWAQKLAQEYS